MSRFGASWMVSLVALPVIIDENGEYKTRKGEIVLIVRTSKKNDFGCDGWYDESNILDSWHKSGRLYFGQLSDNDIVSKVD